MEVSVTILSSKKKTRICFGAKIKIKIKEEEKY